MRHLALFCSSHATHVCVDWLFDVPIIVFQLLRCTVVTELSVDQFCVFTSHCILIHMRMESGHMRFGTVQPGDTRAGKGSEARVGCLLAFAIPQSTSFESGHIGR